MEKETSNPYLALERLFHEPIRLAIMTQLLSTPEGVPFTELRDHCESTDGNLSRHLKLLEEAEAVRIEKSFVANKPRTTIFLTDNGRERFLEYLEALEAVLKDASTRLGAEKQKDESALFLSKTQIAQA